MDFVMRGIVKHKTAYVDLVDVKNGLEFCLEADNPLDTKLAVRKIVEALNDLYRSLGK